MRCRVTDLVAAVASRLRRCLVFCSAIRWAAAFIGTMPLADSRLRKPLGDWAKSADPTRIARGSRNRDVEIK
jgi:hypothetical protein